MYAIDVEKLYIFQEKNIPVQVSLSKVFFFFFFLLLNELLKFVAAAII